MLGWWSRVKDIPPWFQEGMADRVADTGNEIVSRQEAREAMLSGYRIELDESGHLPFPQRPETYGMTWPMFHIQSRMFIEYLRSRDAESFREFITAVVRGAEFGPAFKDAFNQSISHVWEDFIESIDVLPQEHSGISRR
jgi:hypothetical protein